MTLNKTAKEIAEKSLSDFFPDNDGRLTQVLKHMGKSTRVPFVTIWSHKLSGFQESLHYHYKEMFNNFPNLKSVFPEPLILPYHRNQNLRNHLVGSSFNRPPPCHTASNSSPCQKSRCKLCRSMSNGNSILNTQSEKNMLYIRRAMHYHKHYICSRIHTTQIDICWTELSEAQYEV